MATNKIVFGNDVLIDLTSDTVNADSLEEGLTAHAANGEIVRGLAKKTWTGTTAQYESQKNTIPVGTIVNITDDYSGGQISASTVLYDSTESGISADNVQEAIDVVFQSVSNGKSVIASAISDKGIPTLATDTFSTMATNISNIPSGGTELYKFEAFNTGRSTSRTLSDEYIGKHLFIVVYDGQSGAKTYTYLEPIEITGCDSTFLTYLTTSSTYVMGNVYELTNITEAITITSKNGARLLVFAFN